MFFGKLWLKIFVVWFGVLLTNGSLSLTAFAIQEPEYYAPNSYLMSHVTPPVVPDMLPNGVGAKSGAFTYSNEDISIGSGNFPSRLSVTRNFSSTHEVSAFNNWGRGTSHNLNVYIVIETNTCGMSLDAGLVQTFNVGCYPNVATIVVGGKSHVHAKAFLATDWYSTPSQDGGKLIEDTTNNVYEYYGEDGSKIVFDKGNWEVDCEASGMSTKGNMYCYLASYWEFANGEFLSFKNQHPVTTGSDDETDTGRLYEVVNSRGYGLRFSYLNDATTGSYDRDKTMIDGITGFRTGCVGHAQVSCTSGSLPSVSYSYVNGNVGSPLIKLLDTFTDAEDQDFTYDYETTRDRMIKHFGPESSTDPRFEVVYSTNLDANGPRSLVTGYYDGERRYSTYSYTLDEHNPDLGSPPDKSEITAVVYTDPLSVSTTYTFGARNMVEGWQHYYQRPSKVVGPAGTVEYDFIGAYNSIDNRLKTVISQEDNEVQYLYYLDFGEHAVTKATAVAKPSSGLADIVFDADYSDQCTTGNYVCAKPNWTKDGRGHQTDYDYNTYGELTAKLLPADKDGNRTLIKYTYDVFEPASGTFTAVPGTSTAPNISLLVATETCIGNTSFACVGSHIEKITNTYHASTSGTPTSHELLSTSVDPNDLNLVASYSYDKVGNTLTLDGPRTDVSDIITTEYDDLRRVTSTSSPLNESRVAQIYNTAGLVQYSDTYDAKGTATTSDDTLHYRTQTIYNDNGEVEETRNAECFDYLGATATLDLTNAGCGITTNTYDGKGRLSIVTDPAGRKTKTEYYTDDMVHKIIKAYSSSIAQDYATYTYTSNNQVDTVKDANGNVTDYDYDGFDRLNKNTFPSKTTAGSINTSDYESFTYDANFNMLTKRTRAADTITYTYDKLNRVITKAPGSDQAVGYTYDLTGRPTQVKFTTGTTHTIDYTYDKAGRLLTTTNPIGTITYAYGDKVNRTETKWPDNNKVTYSYDALNRMDLVKENGTYTLADYDYNAFGQLSSYERGNVRDTDFAYDGEGALSRMTHWASAVNGTEEVKYDFTYTKANQVASKAVSKAIYFWEPDQDRTDDYTPNGLNQYDKVETGGVEYTLSYNDNGSLTGDGGNMTMTYDVEDRLTQVVKNGVTVDYTYDPNGKLFQKTVDSVAGDKYLTDGNELIADYSNGGTMLRRYVYGANIDERIAYYDSATMGTNRAYYHADYQGSVIGLTDNSGTYDEQYSYGSYGETDVAIGQNPYRYTGRRLDGDTGLYYYRARWYSPSLGRFLQTDPIGYEDGLNWYAYVGNDPVNLTDPSGEKCVSVNGITTCTPEDTRFEEFSFDTPKGWTDFDKDDFTFHDYTHEYNAGKGDLKFEEHLTDELIQSPSPGPNPASPEGTLNDVDILGPWGKDEVKSYVLDGAEGRSIANVTTSNHILHSGFVVRKIVSDGNGGMKIISYGEGNGLLQILPGSDGLAGAAWSTNGQKITSQARKR